VTTRVHHYDEYVANSNYAPLTLDLRDARNGRHVDMTGATVTITIVDETTQEIIVLDGLATQNDDNPYWVEYYLTELEAAKITTRSTWLAYWTLTAGNGRKHHVATPCRIPVRPGTL
jgi:hypothetical protein